MAMSGALGVRSVLADPTNIRSNHTSNTWPGPHLDMLAAVLPLAPGKDLSVDSSHSTTHLHGPPLPHPLFPHSLLSSTTISQSSLPTKGNSIPLEQKMSGPEENDISRFWIWNPATRSYLLSPAGPGYHQWQHYRDYLSQLFQNGIFDNATYSRLLLQLDRGWSWGAYVQVLRPEHYGPPVSAMQLNCRVFGPPNLHNGKEGYELVFHTPSDATWEDAARAQVDLRPHLPVPPQPVGAPFMRAPMAGSMPGYMSGPMHGPMHGPIQAPMHAPMQAPMWGIPQFAPPGYNIPPIGSSLPNVMRGLGPGFYNHSFPNGAPPTGPANNWVTPPPKNDKARIEDISTSESESNDEKGPERIYVQKRARRGGHRKSSAKSANSKLERTAGNVFGTPTPVPRVVSSPYNESAINPNAKAFVPQKANHVANNGKQHRRKDSGCQKPGQYMPPAQEVNYPASIEPTPGPPAIPVEEDYASKMERWLDMSDDEFCMYER